MGSLLGDKVTKDNVQMSDLSLCNHVPYDLQLWKLTKLHSFPRKDNETVVSHSWTGVVLLSPLRKHFALEK